MNRSESKMTYTVHMRNDQTGEVCSWAEPSNWDESQDFWWSEGNAACDCNRFLFFSRAHGEKPTEEECRRFSCETNVFSILKIETPDGLVVYSEC